MNKCFNILLLLILLAPSCKKNKDTEPDNTPPLVVLTQPANGTSNVPVTSELNVEYDEYIILASINYITVNGVKKMATNSGKKIKIQTFLAGNNNYTVNISGSSVKDLYGNFAAEYSFSFTTEASNSDIYEAEDAILSTGLNIENKIKGYSGSGYVGSFKSNTDSLVFHLTDITKGSYDLYIGYSTSSWGSKKCIVAANGSRGEMELTAATAFNKLKFSKVKLLQGNNTIKISPNYTYFLIDYIQLIPNTDPEIPFNIATNLVTQNPTAQAINLYTFLKNNFGTKIISGTMAAHSTNIDEATWVHDQTGKWPALTCFDFIDHTYLNQNWINYKTPFTLGSDWWNNNGIVGFMWHWRDPLVKSGAFYTAETTFDISKISDPTSNEYKAIIKDIDTIAGYLREFMDAEIPVIWRPLHEAAGAWFWWGAKGSAPCKALWQIMFDRLVNYHGLNNLIWVWTTNSNADALNWYPGDDYVDIIGMDIYPGENQHGSQYAEFDKVKEIFKGKKIITLSECGSVPDPALMMEYGDTWSWFMPWNGDFTRTDKNNGAQWWIKLFGYDSVITRDKMPDLK